MTEFSQHLTERTPGAPHLRNTISVNGILLTFIIVSVPCLLFGTWSYGTTRVEATNVFFEFWAGLSTIGPRLTVVLAVACAISFINSRLRQQSMDLGWLPAAWFFVLLLPPDFSLLPATLVISIAMAFGLIAFGGPGLTPFNTSILALMLLILAGAEPMAVSSWHLAVQAEVPAASNLLIGGLPGSIGTMSPLLILLAGVTLILLGQGSAKTLASGIAGLLLGAWLFPAIQGADQLLKNVYGHLLVGNFLFVLVFIAMDPSYQALTAPARWIAGLGYGLLVAAFRLVDPTHPDGAIPALLLIQLATPLVDATVVRVYTWKRRRMING